MTKILGSTSAVADELFSITEGIGKPLRPVDNAGSGGADVTSVNGQTGDVVLDADDISDAATTNKYTTQAEIDKLAGIQAGAEVNTINSGDNISLLANDAGYIDSAGAPVQSVNAQSGAVVLDADDIDDAATTNKFVTAAQIALINGAVQNTGNESIAGDKTFTGSTILAATEVTTGAVLTVDGTQLATVPTIDFSSDATCGIGFADGGRNPGGLSFISNSAQRFTVADTGNISFTSLSLSSNQINSVADPTSAQDAATKNYVDTNAVLKTGDESIAGNKTFTGSTVLDDTEISTGGVLSLDGTQLFNVPTLNFANETTLGFGRADGGRNPGGISVIVDGSQSFIFDFDRNVSLLPFSVPTYTVATAPSVADGAIIYVTDGDAGSPCFAGRSGGAWKVIALGANISTT